MYAYTDNSMMPSVMRTFAFSLAIAFVGTMAGVFVPPALFLPLVIIELAMLIGVFFLRKKKAISYAFLYAFTFISGMTMYPVIAHYIAVSGANVVINALGATTVVFTGLAIYATKTKRDLSFLGGMLMAALLALIAVSIFNWIWPLSTTGMMAYSFIGILVFSGYVLFDFNRMKHYGVSPEEVPLMALNLYLDFINLFLYILRFFGILSSND
ncbi:Bax inhibitor-1/YccA family protein [Bacillus sp. ISL-35]|uniref:Bax inhibitor-1/YccA family protein n=1 Tax=Bacillus sp. ISL-35 TaxID=2819122 RepID=UPI001BED0E74|nr:Bax inhibitor-1/YccA family protein [Bacillus sp. ISL-35]MBT2679769.1 Bax inhibitor-1/YccA family protein [Bacillus sp. ISL-35]MBT2704803.1 Bax inhibitor-1/YccA family protein [Chryseobacterium sp. ISL-80]